MTIDCYTDCLLYLNKISLKNKNNNYKYALKVSAYYEFTDKIDKELLDNLYFHLNINNKKVNAYKCEYFSTDRNKFIQNSDNFYVFDDIIFTDKKIFLNNFINFKFEFPNNISLINNSINILFELIIKDYKDVLFY